MTTFEKLGLAGVIFILGVASGWLVHQWKSDSEQLSAQSASEKAYRKAAERAEALGQSLQTTLDRIGDKRLSSTKEIFHETTKIEYRCLLPESGRLLYNSAVASSPGSP